jgi:hypothetical protein
MKLGKHFLIHFIISLFCFLLPLIYYHFFDEQHNSMGAGFRQAFLLILQFAASMIILIINLFSSKLKKRSFFKFLVAFCGQLIVSLIYQTLNHFNSEIFISEMKILYFLLWILFFVMLIVGSKLDLLNSST